MVYKMYFISHFQGLERLDSWEKIDTLLYIFSLHFWQRKDQGFVALFGIHVALCVDGLLLSVFVSCLCVSFTFSYLLQLNT